jgi:hypothetical protein
MTPTAKMLALGLGLLAGTAWSAGPAPDAAMAPAAERMALEHLTAGVTGEAGRRSIRGTKALWVQVLLMGGTEGMPDLEMDLRRSDMEGQLRDQGFRVMDPAKRSLAIGLRPSLVLVVFYSPANQATGTGAFYVVQAKADQQCTPLGGDETTLTTWASNGDPLPASGNAAADAEAIRASARDCVKAFIDAAKSSDGDR